MTHQLQKNICQSFCYSHMSEHINVCFLIQPNNLRIARGDASCIFFILVGYEVLSLWSEPRAHHSEVIIVCNFTHISPPFVLNSTLYTRSPPQARAIKLRIALVLVEWNHAGGGETNIDLGQYWSLAARLACILPLRTHQDLFSVP